MIPVPKIGDALRLSDAQMIIDATSARKHNFPDEPFLMSMGVVLLNIGEQYAKVECVMGEWKGIKRDIPNSKNSNSLPKCPNGHVLLQGAGLKLGWIGR